MPVTHKTRWICSQLGTISGEELQPLIDAGRPNLEIARRASTTEAWMTYLRAQPLPPGAVPVPLNWHSTSAAHATPVAYTGLIGGFTNGPAVWASDIL